MQACEHTEKHTLFCGRVSVSLFGAGRDWKLSDRSTVATISMAAHMSGVCQVYSPNISQFNARICKHDELTEDVTTGIVDAKVPIFRGAHADGVIIGRRSACFLATADCPTVIMWSHAKPNLVCLHAGLRSLVDFRRVEEGASNRVHESVIDASLELFGRDNAHKVHVHALCGIAADNYSFPEDHADWGGFNRKLLKALREMSNGYADGAVNGNSISLPLLIRAQCMARGVRADRISWDTIDTYSDRDHIGGYRWNSHRMERNGVSSVYGRNNGVLVSRLW